jgi:hypothetical protein
MNRQNGEMGIQAQTKLETQLTIDKLNNDMAQSTDRIQTQLLRHGGEKVIKKSTS